MNRIEIEPFAFCQKVRKYVKWDYCSTKCPHYSGETGNYDSFNCSYNPTEATVRTDVALFAIAMETVLQKNDHKGGWRDLTPEHIEHRLKEEWKEYKESGNPDELIDVANFIMFLYWITRSEVKE